MRKTVITMMCILLTGITAKAQLVGSQTKKIETTYKTTTKTVVVNDYKNYNRISLGLSSLKLKDSDNEEVLVYEKGSIGMKGLDINYLHGFSMTDRFPLYLEVGGRLTVNHYKESENDYDDENNYYEAEAKTNIMALSIPVNATYKHTFSNGIYIAPFVGLHLRFNMLGKLKLKEKSVSRGHIEFDDDDSYNLFKDGEVDEEDCKRVQFGGQFGVNFGYKAWNLSFAYYLDTPFYKDSDFKLKSRDLSLTVGYNF